MPPPEVNPPNTNMTEGGKISSVRRTFCLFVTFDLGLSFILWVLYTQLHQGSSRGWDAFKEQVENYKIQKSLFDTVMLAAVRFVFLILAYALFRLQHWWTVALTTLLSSAFLLTKVFIFDFSDASISNNPLSYCVLIVSFVLAWVETWFLDFKVLPHEKKERDRLARSLQPNYGGVAVGPPFGDRRRLLRSEDALSQATFDQYYSPLGTPEGSDNEEEEVNGAVGGLGRTVPQSQLDEYKRLAKECWDELWYYLTCPESEWKHETGQTLEDGIIHSRQVKGWGKVFKLQGMVDIDAKSLWEEMVHNINNAPSWNPTLLECATVMVIDSNTDISYNVANEAAGGLVSSRDFVNLRHWGVKGEWYLSAGHGVTHPDFPPKKKHIRGFNGPGGWAFRPVPGDPDKCIFVWIMNTDIKGWIPQRLVDQAASGVLLDYLKAMRQHVQNMRKPGV